MNDMNRLLIFLLLAGLLFALYKYQHLIFGQSKVTENPVVNKDKKSIRHTNNQQLSYEEKPTNKVTLDNISQISLGSLDDEDGSPPKIYKQDSILGSIDSNTIGSAGSLFEDNSRGSRDSGGSMASNGSNESFFF